MDVDGADHPTAPPRVAFSAQQTIAISLFGWSHPELGQPDQEHFWEQALDMDVWWKYNVKEGEVSFLTPYDVLCHWLSLDPKFNQFDLQASDRREWWRYVAHLIAEERFLSKSFQRALTQYHEYLVFRSAEQHPFGSPTNLFGLLSVLRARQSPKHHSVTSSSMDDPPAPRMFESPSSSSSNSTVNGLLLSPNTPTAEANVRNAKLCTLERSGVPPLSEDTCITLMKERDAIFAEVLKLDPSIQILQLRFEGAMPENPLLLDGSAPEDTDPTIQVSSTTSSLSMRFSPHPTLKKSNISSPQLLKVPNSASVGLDTPGTPFFRTFPSVRWNSSTPSSPLGDYETLPSSIPLSLYPISHMPADHSYNAYSSPYTASTRPRSRDLRHMDTESSQSSDSSSSVSEEQPPMPRARVISVRNGVKRTLVRYIPPSLVEPQAEPEEQAHNEQESAASASMDFPDMDTQDHASEVDDEEELAPPTRKQLRNGAAGKKNDKNGVYRPAAKAMRKKPWKESDMPIEQITNELLEVCERHALTPKQRQTLLVMIGMKSNADAAFLSQIISSSP